jgi:dienelactone hydrolase
MKKSFRRLVVIILTAIVVLLGTFIFVRFLRTRNISVNNATLPEEIVFAKSSDDIVDGGVIFNAKEKTKKRIAVIWVHGWGVNFYSPTYISIGRAIAERGYTCITVNTRMHDIGNVEGYKGDKRLRGGGYWGVASDEVKDLSAWIDFAESQGFKEMILVGHSAGWAAVRMYQAEKQDNRVIGLVCASGGIIPGTGPTDSVLLLQARLLMAADKGDELIKIPKRSFPSYISAATFMDDLNTPSEYGDFFGFNTSSPGIIKIHCPILAFFGTYGDVGDEAELDSLQSCIKKHSSIQVKVTTTMINNAEHMYVGEERQVAETITKWVDDISKVRNNE